MLSFLTSKRINTVEVSPDALCRLTDRFFVATLLFPGVDYPCKPASTVCLIVLSCAQDVLVLSMCDLLDIGINFDDATQLVDACTAAVAPSSKTVCTCLRSFDMHVKNPLFMTCAHNAPWLSMRARNLCVCVCLSVCVSLFPLSQCICACVCVCVRACVRHVLVGFWCMLSPLKCWLPRSGS